MAKAKGKDIVGWSGSGYGSSGIEIVTEWDVNQTKNRKAGLGSTWSKGHIVRQLGLARLKTPKGHIYFLYSHSQVSNAGGYTPAAWVGLTRNDLEQFFGVIGKELFGVEE